MGSGELVPQQTLIWSNVADIQAADEFSLSFAVATNGSPSATYPTLPVFSVGSTVQNVGEAYASSDPWVLPRFDADGNPVPDPSVTADTSPTRTTRLSAIQVDKAEPSPEGGSARRPRPHHHLHAPRCASSPLAGVDGVRPHRPAARLPRVPACGDVDNSSDEEYPGSGPLGTTGPISDCPDPVAVDTVVDPPPAGSTTYPAGVYTAVRWDLGNLSAGGDVTVRYVAGIPLNENVPFPAPAPTPESLLQAANLDNNTLPSTREGIPESSVTNVGTGDGHLPRAARRRAPPPTWPTTIAPRARWRTSGS